MDNAGKIIYPYKKSEIEVIKNYIFKKKTTHKTLSIRKLFIILHPLCVISDGTNSCILRN